MTMLADADARRRILTEFDRTFFVEAAAGTGKTTALVGRIIGLIRTGAGTLGRLVAVTFTEKAAGEMKLRLRSEIERARAEAPDEQRVRFETALEELELAHIGTIHSFCGDLLRERPVEARVDPMFEVAAEEDAAAVGDEAFDQWFERMLAEPPEGIRRILRRRASGDSPREALRAAFHKLRDHRDFPTSWRRDQFDRKTAIDRIVAKLENLGKIGSTSSWPDDYLARNLTVLGRFVEEVTRLEAVRGRDHDGLEQQLRTLSRDRSWNWKGARRTAFGDLSRDAVLALRDEAKTELDAFVASCDADLAPLLHESLQEAIALYEVFKARSGKLDFLDLLIKARDLIRDDADARADLQQRFSHFFIDEFQDTDPLQVEILLLLASDDATITDWHAAHPLPGKLFLVGDPKQSVYRFRRADVALYEQVKDRLIGLGAELLHLTTSFRSVPSIQAFVNGAFEPVMPSGANDSQAAYVALQPFRDDVADRPTVVALPVPAPYGDYGKIIQSRIMESYPEAVGAFIDWLVNESGWTIEERGQKHPVRPRNIAILSRRFRNFGHDVMRPYVRALEVRNLPHVLVGGRSFHDREEVIALRNALVAIEWPDDELRVFATLRGPFFALGDEALLAYRQFIAADGSLQHRRLHALRPAKVEELAPVAQEVLGPLTVLAELHSGRNRRPIAQTITMLLEALRVQAGAALWPNGEQALANCQRLVDMARHFERHASSFRAFVEKLESDADRGEADEAPIVEEGTEGVRIMTVHKAKGLEFPVVILVDPTCSATHDKPSRHVDPGRRLWLESVCGCTPIELVEAAGEELKRDQAEAVRLAYVAVTRARDLLVIPACGDQPIEGWLSVLDPMVYPSRAERRNGSPAPGCPAFGDDSVFDRGTDGVSTPEGPVRPGLHRLGDDGPSVVWWDPGVLNLEVEEGAPIRHQRLLEAEGGGVGSESERDYVAWKEAKAEMARHAAEPSLVVQTLSTVARDLAKSERMDVAEPVKTSVRVEYVGRDQKDRPAGRRFGALVHAILATVDFAANSDVIRESAVGNGRLLGATDVEIDSAVHTVTSTLQHPILQRAAAARSSNVRRETPVILRREDGTLVEGVVDLAFREDTIDFSGWTIVDFKTDRESEATSAQYEFQVSLYADAVAIATGLAARGILLIL